MKNSFLFTLFVMPFLFFACEEDNNGSDEAVLTLTVAGFYEEAPLQMFEETYAYEDGMNIQFQLFQFYISDFSLLKADGTAEEILDIELASFKDVTSEDAALEGLHFTIPDVPTGTYTGVRFGLGVAPDMNATSPADYTPPHPLDDHYWSWATGYVFTKIEGLADLDGDGSLETPITFHSGKDPFYRTVEIPMSFLVQGGAGNQVGLEVDLKEVLAPDSQNFLDFRETPIDHSKNEEVVEFLLGNLANALQVKNN